MQVLPTLFKLWKLWPWVDLDLFYDKVKFGYIGFCMGRSENYLFFGDYCSLRSQSCSKHSAKWVNEVESIKGQGHSLTLVKGHSNFKVKCLTLVCILRWAIQGLTALLYLVLIDTFETRGHTLCQMAYTFKCSSCNASMQPSVSLTFIHGPVILLYISNTV